MFQSHTKHQADNNKQLVVFEAPLQLKKSENKTLLMEN